MLGLKRHTVKLSKHSVDWETSFLATKNQIIETIGDFIIDIQHVGSTAIKNIPAKPILDIAIAVKTVEQVAKCKEELEELGYEYRGDCGKDGGHLFVKCSEIDVRTEHLHFVEIDGVQWKNYLNFRNFLNANHAKAMEYANLKKELAHKFPEDRRAYTAGKNDFISKILSEIS